MRKSTAEWISGNVFIRANLLEFKGDKCDGHKHNFAHTTIIRKGSVHVKATLPDGTIKEGDFFATGLHGHFLVKADVEHEIIALEDNTEFWCIYSHRDAQGRVTEENEGWGGDMAAYQ